MRSLIAALAAMLAMQIFVSMANSAGGVLAPAAASDIGVSPQLIGVLVAIIYCVSATVSLVSGGVITRFGALRTAQASLVFAALALAMMSQSSTAAIVLGALLMGVAVGPATPASSQAMIRVTPTRWMNIVFSIRQTGIPLGVALSGALLPPLESALGWRGALLVTGAACLIFSLVLQPFRAEFDADRDPDHKLTDAHRLIRPLVAILREPDLRSYSIASFFYGGLQACLTFYLVTFLTERIDMSLAVAGLVLGSSQILAAFGRIFWGVAADYWVDPTVLLGWLGVAMSVAAIATGLFTPAWPLSLIVTTVMLLGVTSTAWNGVLVAQMARLAPEGHVGEIVGAGIFACYSGVVAMPLLFGAVLAMTGSYAASFTIVAATTLASGLFLLLRMSRGRRAA